MTQPSTDLPDHRADLSAAQRWVAGLIAGVRPEQHGDPTPCSEYDVRTLVRHLYGVADRAVVMGAGRPAESVSALHEGLPDDWAAGFLARVAASERAWADAASLTRVLEVPWGRAPAAVVLPVYVAENLTHGWDLAVATGQDPEADPALAEIALTTMQRVLPVAGREDVPFAEPVTLPEGAGPTEQLAAWSGHARP